MSVFCLGSDEINRLWNAFGHHLTRLEREGGLVLASEMRVDLVKGYKQLWGWQENVITGVAVTEIVQSPKGPICRVCAACGTETNKGQIDAIIAEIEAWARNIGCTRMMLHGRRGWLRRLKRYRQVGVVLEKEF